MTILLGHTKIHFVGHSMGTTTFMALMNEKPEYADKIIMANFLAPVAYVEHMRSPIRFLAPFTDSIEVSMAKKLKGRTKFSSRIRRVGSECAVPEGHLRQITHDRACDRAGGPTPPASAPRLASGDNLCPHSSSGSGGWIAERTIFI